MIWINPPITVANARGVALIVQLLLIKKHPIIILEFKIIGVNANIQNFPETFVATPSIATIEINGMKIIVILESVVI